VKQPSLRHFSPLVFALVACFTRPAPHEPPIADVGEDSTTTKFLKSSGTDRPDISVSLRADRTTMVPGDTVRFTLVARNAGNTRVQVGVQCGPAMDIRITNPNGGLVSVLNAQFQDEKILVAFTCELGPYHFAESRDSLLNHLWWKAPSLRGKYVAVAGARGAHGLDVVSPPLVLTVR
jgi:hypothetical protein